MIKVDAYWAFGLSHRGVKRRENQDRFLVRPGAGGYILAVADGLGGHGGGGTAAQCVIQALAGFSFSQARPRVALAQALSEAETALDRACRDHAGMEDMGTTLSLALVQGGRVHYLHVGDSRLYGVRGNGLEQVTTDQTFLQYLIDDNSISLEQARSHPLRGVLDQCVGMGDLEPEMGILLFDGPGVLLLCTDGLSGYLSHEVIEGEVLKSMDPGRELKNIAHGLLNKALAAGGRDNITLVLARVPGGNGGDKK